MKKPLQMLCILGAMIFSASNFAGCGKFDAAKADKYFTVPKYADNVEMWIGGFSSPSFRLLNEKTWDEAFQDAAELGLTHVHPERITADFGRNPDDAMRFLDLAYKYKLKVLMADSGLGIPHLDGPIDMNQWDTSWAEEYTRHPAFGAIYLMDEPRYESFENLGQKAAQWRKEFPRTGLMSNLVNAGGKHAFLHNTYREFIDAYMEKISPDMLYFAHYPLMNDGSITATYFQELAIISSAAKRYGVPAGAYILTTGHSSSTTQFKHMPSAQDLRWQISAMLAFGHKSFSHYAIDPPYGGGYTGDGYDRFYTDGERNDLWYAVQTVNREMRKWDHVYLNFNWLGTAPVVGDAGLTAMFNIIEDGVIKSDAIDGITSIESTRDLLVGCFEDAAKNKGFMVSNASNPSRELAADAEIQFGKEYKGVQVWEKGVPRVIKLDKDGKAHINLEWGEGKFLIPLKAK